MGISIVCTNDGLTSVRVCVTTFYKIEVFSSVFVICMNYRVQKRYILKTCIKSGVFIYFSWFFHHIILTLGNFGGVICKAIKWTHRANKINMRSMVKIRLNSDSPYSVNRENAYFDKQLLQFETRYLAT